MKATFEVPDRIFAAASSLAARNGLSLESLVVRALDRELGESARMRGKGAYVTLPLIASKNPGALRAVTGSDLDELLA